MVRDLEYHFAPQIHHSYVFFLFTEILCGLTVRGFQSAVTTTQHASVYHQCQLRAAACYFCGVSDEATVERMLKFQPLIVDFDL